MSREKKRFSLRAFQGVLEGINLPPLSFTSVAVDSRLVTPGALFFALPGAHTDGHHYLRQAEERGAVAALVSSHYREERGTLPLIRVDNPLYALQELSRHKLALTSPRVVAITGSVGKTSCKSFLFELLKRGFTLSCSPRNQNSQIGVPLTLFNEVQGEEELLILEMGMSQKEQIQRLVEIAPPEVALITTTALAHAEFFESLEEIGKAKAEIFSHPATKRGFLSADILNKQELLGVGSCEKSCFSLQTKEADFYGKITPQGFEVYERASAESYLFPPLPFPAPHLYHNLLAAIAIARYLKISVEEISETIPSLKAQEKRFELSSSRGIIWVNDAYNACDLSMIAALNSLPTFHLSGKRVALLGEMKELGSFSPLSHRKVGICALEVIDHLLCLGDSWGEVAELWKSLGRHVTPVVSKQEAIDLLKELLEPGDLLLVKGASCHRLWEVIEELTQEERSSHP